MQRDKSIDFIKFVLIVLVILRHIAFFCDTYPSIRWNIKFLMPAFLLVTGYLVNMNKTVRQFSMYMLRMVLPYLIVVTGYCIISYFIPTQDGLTQLSVQAICHKLLITSIGPYWFLLTIIVCGGAYYACFRALRNTKNEMTKLGILLLTLYAICQIYPSTAFDIYSFVYYFIGVALCRLNIPFSSAFRPSFVSIFIVILIGSVERYNEWNDVLLLCAVYCSLSSLLWIYPRIKDCKIKDAFLYIGRNTLPIYLFHPIFTMAAKFYHPLFAFDSSEIIFTLVTICIAVAGSLAIARMMERTRAAWIFGKGKMLR